MPVLPTLSNSSCLISPSHALSRFISIGPDSPNNVFVAQKAVGPT